MNVCFFSSRWRVAIGLLLCVFSSIAAAADITALRAWRAPDNTRLVLDLTAPVVWRVSPDSSPARLIIEIDDAMPAGPIAMPTVTTPLRGIRLERNGRGQRLVIDTAVELKPRIFQLAPNEKYSQRLVLDLYDTTVACTTVERCTNDVTTALKTPVDAKDIVTQKVAAPELVVDQAPVRPVPRITEASVASSEKASDKALDKTTEKQKSGAEKTRADNKSTEKAEDREGIDPKRYRPIVVAIDAGHGGEDPGALGANGSHEKHVTLAIARELQAMLNEEPGIKAVLTRTDDYFLALQERRRIARYKHKADIFISVHADAAPSRAAKGASVFALSLKGANTATSRFASMLAERENRADLIGGAALDEGDDVLRNVLADMVVAGSLEHSLHMGSYILSGLGRIGSLHSRDVEQAGFAVLKEPGMVSLLVETGFISNPDEEAKLIDKDYQRQLARAIFDGIRRYCFQYPAPGTYFAALADKNKSSVTKASSKADAMSQVATTEPSSRSLMMATTEASSFDASSVDASDAPQKMRERKNQTAASNKSEKNTSSMQRHKVKSGENLSRLAERYGVSSKAIRDVNNLADDQLRIGQVLKIPKK